MYIPGMAGVGMSFPELRWDYETVPQEHLGGRRTNVGAGKALGGGTIGKVFLIFLLNGQFTLLPQLTA